MSRLRVSVNSGKCQAYRRCTAIAPAVFTVGPDGKATVLRADGAPDDEVVKAARSCPYRAITVTVDASGEQIFPPLPKSQPPSNRGMLMEHQRFDYSPITRRPPLEFPNSARVAVWIVPNVEHFHYDKPAISLTPMTTALKPDVLNYAWRDYGVRVGIWRLMEVLERHGFRATAAVNSEVVEQYPQIIEEGTRLGWEWLAHGANNSSLFTGMPAEVERGIIAEVLRTLEQKTGKRPRGWLGPALTETENTLDILAQAGIEYVADWCNDELPYDMRTRHGTIVAMPYTLEIGDIPIFLTHGGTGEDFYRIAVDQFDTLYEEGARSPRVFCMALHPFLIGHPFRARHLERVLRHIREYRDVWLTTGGQLLDCYRAQRSAKP